MSQELFVIICNRNNYSLRLQKDKTFEPDWTAGTVINN